MSDMNLCIFQGNFVKDPESRTVNTQKGESTVAKFTIAVNSGRKDAKALFVDCEVWGDDADRIVKFFTKGKPIRVYTEQVTDVYDDKEGKKVYRTKHRVNNFFFVNSGKPEGEEGAPAPAEPASRPAAAKTAGKPATRKATPKPEPESDDEGDDEEIPF